MGFFKACIDFVVAVIASPLFSYGDPYGGSQITLHISDPVHAPSPVAQGHGLYPTIDPRSCRYPKLEAQGYKLCNDEDKTCWLRRENRYDNPWLSQWDITTDYETFTPTGVTREYYLTVDKTTLSPDGQPKIGGVTFNGTYPGPAIEACWGDQIIVRVRNNYCDNGTTVHWHGIRQFGSNEMDGVNGVTQCPIPCHSEYVYNFTAAQYGHTWYHSHYSLQYPDGVAGPLVIHGPTSSDWDIDLGPVMIADWVHDTAFDAFNCEAYSCAQGESPPRSDSIVVNGIGRWRAGLHSNFTGNYFNATFTPGKRHLLRLINASAASSFVFSIDNHTMTVVASDLVAVEPYQTDSILVGIGQRYTVIVEADQKPSLYWMRTAPAQSCNSFRGNDTTHVFNNTEETAAIIKYKGAPHPDGLPPASSVKQQKVTYECRDESEDPKRLKPVVPWYVDQHPVNNVTEDTFTAGLENASNIHLYPEKPYAHWVLASSLKFSNPLWVNFSNPTILDPDVSPDFSSIVRVDESNGFVYLIVDGTFAAGPIPGIIPINTSHPIHLHGSDFVVLAQNRSTWDPLESPKYFKWNNPARRDVAMLPAGGYLALAFKPDNPGAWLMHCHIAWHASSGLALQLVIRPKDIPEINGPLEPVEKLCEEWRAWTSTDPVVQTDSGI
ncbi:multicopper oxidase-domain-containing protein [Diplogelasinospora grovesii]|uniref:Multicopper oxidase-domain-containing protein n=1 Tax=Diplogelasinospora grovesii TaxID=303347 RepID=A0AAN6S2L8_9PEZI|nr:multicopper oxidase-domain-containing protein [Diplogelasinospora grovesii]